MSNISSRHSAALVFAWLSIPLYLTFGRYTLPFTDMLEQPLKQQLVSAPSI